MCLLTPPWIHRPRRMETLKTSDNGNLIKMYTFSKCTSCAVSSFNHHMVRKDKHKKYRKARNSQLDRMPSGQSWTTELSLKAVGRFHPFDVRNVVNRGLKSLEMFTLQLLFNSITFGKSDAVRSQRFWLRASKCANYLSSPRGEEGTGLPRKTANAWLTHRCNLRLPCSLAVSWMLSAIFMPACSVVSSSSFTRSSWSCCASWMPILGYLRFISVTSYIRWGMIGLFSP